MNKRISIILPDNLNKEIQIQMSNGGYSFREKSAWISEAIEDFLKLKGYQALVETANLIDDLKKTVTIRISSDIEEKLEKAIIKVRKHYPGLEGVKSLIVRASVIRRLVLLGTKK